MSSFPPASAASSAPSDDPSGGPVAPPLAQVAALLDLTERRCVVVGGTPAAARAAALLLGAGARVVLVAPRGPELPGNAGLAGRLTLWLSPFAPRLLAGAVLLVVATGDAARDRAISDAARWRNVPVSVVDRPELGTLAVPALGAPAPLFHGRSAARLSSPPAASPRAFSPGTVYLVGAGPGDPELLTVRALDLLRRADTVLHDSLVDRRILALCRPDAELLDVGKRAGRHACAQGEINGLLVALTRQGKCVVRLKGGDPLLFGRGGEEIETLAEQGIPFEIVPGITAATGCAAYAGIPLTHRDHAQACVFVTGHTKNGRLDLSWPALVQPRQTLVVYMGLKSLPLLARELVRHGLAAETPAAAIDNGTLGAQRVVVGTLRSLPRRVRRAALEGPALVIVGSVVRLRDRLAWFDEGFATAAPGSPKARVAA